jgi:hypothetical protein
MFYVRSTFGTFCPFSAFLKPGDKRDITVQFIQGPRPEGGGKENGTVSSVIRQRQEPLSVLQSGFQLLASEVNTWPHVTFC